MLCGVELKQRLGCLVFAGDAYAAENMGDVTTSARNRVGMRNYPEAC